MDIISWQSELARLIALCLAEWHKNNQNIEIAMFCVDCHPWNGLLNLSILTQAELDQDQLLADTDEMAAWKHFAFSAGYEVWAFSKDLGIAMQHEYNLSTNLFATSEKYFYACASAVAGELVLTQLANMTQSSSFKISVTNPDSHKEYYSAS